MKRPFLFFCGAAWLMCACAYIEPERLDESAGAEGIGPIGPRSAFEAPPVPVEQGELSSPAAFESDLDAVPRDRAAEVEAEVWAAIEARPSLISDVESLEIRATDAGLEVSGAVLSKRAYDDVIDLVRGAAPGVFVENDLVVVIELSRR